MVVGGDDKVEGRVDMVVGRDDKAVGGVDVVEGLVEVRASLQLSQVSEEGGRLNHVGGGAVSGGVGVEGG